MKKLEQIYDEVHSDNIEVAEVPADSYTAYSCENEWAKMIALNPNMIKDDKEKLIALYHEYMHIKYGLLYDKDTDKELVDKLEYKADKKLFNDLMPRKEIMKLHSEGYTLPEIADKLEVPLKKLVLAEFLYENVEGFANE